ncbi:MAG: hypothetical protein ACOYBM_05030 [Dethiobacteria bacterium]
MDRYGNFSIFCAQLFGTTRTFISLPAGATKINLGHFIVYTTLGGILFSIVAISFSLVLTRFWGLIINTLL